MLGANESVAIFDLPERSRESSVMGFLLARALVLSPLLIGVDKNHDHLLKHSNALLKVMSVTSHIGQLGVIS